MTKTQILGLFLWRAGLLLVGSYSVLRLARLALTRLDLPAVLDWGLGLIATGTIFVAISFILERSADMKAEGGLKE